VTQYQTLYRKYRSQTFADLVGQEAVSRALQGAVAGERVAHAYLFSGTRGTGKTSTARLLAKALNCSARPAGSSEPCNKCESCLGITGGAALDLIEIDAASNRGIDEIRDLREKVHLAPAIGPKKIYIIDEAHMLTQDAFNALLKTLEEPPEHVVFILCTTEAQKVPATVLGRCLHFVFRRFTDDEIVARLRYVAASEGIAVEDSVLALVARAAQGSMRDAIGLLDQLVPLSAGTIGLAEARDLLQIADPELVARLLDLVLAGQAREALDVLGTIYAAGAEYRSVVRGLMERARDLLVAAVEQRDEALRTRLSAALDALVHLDGEVRRHGEPRFLVEATLVRLAAAAGLEPRHVEVAPAPTRPEPAPTVVAEPANRPAPAPAAVEPAPIEAAAAPAAVEPAPIEAAAAPAADLTDGWRGVLDQLKPSAKAIFREARPELRDGTLVLAFRYAWHFSNAPKHLAELEPLVAAWLERPTKIQFTEDASSEARASEAAPRPLTPDDHPMVQAAVKKLEGKVVR
jgi:DNA polymerase III subunit gamma/tau